MTAPTLAPADAQALRILALQRTAGNRAVTQALSRGHLAAAREATITAEDEQAVRDRAGTTEERDVRQRGPQAKSAKALVSTGTGSMADDPRFEAAGIRFEDKLGAVAWTHPRADGAAAQMAKSAKEYVRLKAAEPWEENSKRLGELLQKTGSESPEWSGSVGKAIKDLMEVFDAGNIAERMAHAESFFVEILGSDLAESNALLVEEALDRAEAAGLDADLLAERHEEMERTGGRGKFGIIDTPQDAAVADQWHARAPRNTGPDASARNRSTRTIAETGASLSSREVALHKAKDPGWDPAKDPVMWAEGVRIWTMNERDAWVRAQRKVSLPLGAGPSGTTNKCMQAARVLGVSDAQDARLACIAYLLPARHHTLVEIMTGAAAQGVPFTAGRGMYRDIPPLNDAELLSCAEGGKFPDELGEVAAEQEPPAS